MKEKPIILIIILGAIVLYCAKILISASIAAITDSMEAYYSILGWAMYMIGELMFLGGIVASAIDLIASSYENH